METGILIHKILNEITNSAHILLVCHQNPDGDALGSITAFSQYLDNLNKQHVPYCVHTPHLHYHFLPNIEKIVQDSQIIDQSHIDLVIVLDSGDVHITGIPHILQKYITNDNVTVINIDHHYTNSRFGNINLIIPEAVSTTEILYKIFQKVDFDFDRNMAISLMAGILGDTNNFTNQNTTPESLRIASELLAAGAPLPAIYDQLNKNKTLHILRQWGLVFDRLTVNKNFNITYTVIKKEDALSMPGNKDVSEGLPNYLNQLTGSDVVMLLKETPDGNVKGSLRTNSDLIDVSKLAIMLGGGGHEKAAGFTMKGELVETENGWQVR